MAEVEHSTTAKLPVDVIWEFVKEMDNWAAHMAGYQSHEKRNEDDSVWVLKGDVGSLTRTLRFEVHVTEWAAPERVSFVLRGLNEQMEGRGEFLMQAYEEETAAPKKRNPLSRLVEAVVRFFWRLARGRVERDAAADTGPGEGMARLTFKLKIDPGGPMAPMINAMMKPAMTVAAEDLATRIVADVERRQAAG